MRESKRQARIDGYDAQIQRLIDKHGWAVQGVLPAAGGPGAPFAYTVGLTLERLPELVVYGLPPQTAQAIVNTAATRMVEAGEFVPGERIGGLVKGFDLAVIDVVDLADLAMVRRFYGHGRATQLVWPDPQGHFPWHPGYGMPLEAQPLAGVPPAR